MKCVVYSSKANGYTFDDNSKQCNYPFSHLLRRLMQHWSLSNHEQTKTHLILTDPGEQVITNSGSSDLQNFI